ncbi:MAG: MlaD family protein [Bacteroidales bacterium]|nr:MlaD family protein [Bacteroidales bacterium]
MKENLIKNIRLGFFIIVGLILFILAIYYLGSQKNLFGSRIEIGARFHNVEGLRVGNNVLLSGINVGNVKSINIINDSTIRVDLLIDKDVQGFIKKDSKVSIGSAGLLGDKNVYISYGSPNAQMVEEGDVLPTATTASMDDMFSQVKETSMRANQIAKDLSSILSKINKGKGDLGKILHDTVLYHQLSTATSNLRRASEEVDEISTNISDISQKINKGEGDIARLLNDTTITAQFHKTLSEMDTASVHLKSFTQDLNQSQGLVNKLIRDTTFAHKVDSSVNNFNQAAKTVNGKLGQLKDNWLVNLFFDVKSDTTGSAKDN